MPPSKRAMREDPGGPCHDGFRCPGKRSAVDLQVNEKSALIYSHVNDHTLSMKTLFVTLLVSMLLVAGITSYVAVLTDSGGQHADLSTFRSKTELNSFLDSSSTTMASGESADFLLGGPDTARSMDGEGDYSRTNVQVEGVDESDMVKTDGEFLYVANQEGITILRAHPPERLGIVSQIAKESLIDDEVEFLWIAGLFILQGQLVVISSTQGDVMAFADLAMLEARLLSPTESRTFVSVLDIEDIENPSLVHSYEVSGGIRASRMTSNHVYIVTQVYITEVDGNYSYPNACIDGRCEDFDLEKISYNPEAEGATSFANILAIDPAGGGYDYISVITGYASTIYMSRNSLYITFYRNGGETAILSPLGRASFDGGPVTSIYKIGVDGTALWIAASGDVSGRLLNQFSMDERGPYLRVVTTVGWTESRNNVYVLDEDLDLIGALEGLAPRETVYSARFVGDALYLVTFKKVDPFFVIDLSDPEVPRVLGYLKIPGFSEYLHPLDERHVLGVGKDTVEADEGDFAWFQGLKLSLFDVTDVGDPKELAKYIIGDRGTSSAVLEDHKAFLYIQSRDMIVLPIDLAEIDESKYLDEPPSFAHGELVWQGVYVISVNAEGFQLLGRISHFDSFVDPKYDPYYHSPYSVTRSLYIGDYLYTISDSVVRVDSLDDLSPIGHVVYGSQLGKTEG